MVIIRGAGDIASGVALRLYNCNIPVIMTDIAYPTAIRRTVSFCEAIHNNTTIIEGVQAKLAGNVDEALNLITNKIIPVMIDPDCNIARTIKPIAIIDAILAKQNLGTNINQAPIVIALGPGFEASYDCHCVIETMRGHTLGRPIYTGFATPNTGIPGDIGGYTVERIIRACHDGEFHPILSIGDLVEIGDIVAYVDEQPIYAMLKGTLRGILPKGTLVHTGMKSGDIDPRCKIEHCYTVSDKALAIGGGVLEALLHLSDTQSLLANLWTYI